MTVKRRIGSLIGIGVVACLAAGCDDGEGDALTPEEAAALAELIGRTSFDPLVSQSLGSLPAEGSTAPSAQKGGVKEYDFDKSCSEGGSVNLSGTADYDFGEDGFGVEVDGTIAFDHCAEKTDDGVTYALTGGIDHLVRMSGGYSEGTVGVEVDGTATGSVDWENEDDGSSGVCEVDVTIDVAIEFDKEGWSWEVEGGVTGTVCGISVDVEAKNWLKKGWKGY